MTLIRTPFRKKRRTVAGDEISRRSESQTPLTTRSATNKSRCVSTLSVNSESNSNTFDVSSTNTEYATKENFYADLISDFEFDFNINSLFNDYDDYVDESDLTNAGVINVLETIEINECKHLEEHVENDESEAIKIPDVKEKISKIHLPHIPKIFSFSSHLENDTNVKGSISKGQEISVKDRRKFFSFFKKKASLTKSLDLSSDNEKIKIETDFILCRRCTKQIIYSVKEVVESNVDKCNCEKITDDDGIYIKNSAYKDVSQ